MIEFLMEYGLFLLKVVTLVLGIVTIISVASSAGRKSSLEGLEVENLNEKHELLVQSLKLAVLNKTQQKSAAKEKKKKDKASAKEISSRPRSFVIDFKGDLKASAVPSLRQEVSAILDVATSDDEVIVRLENYGGVVHEHGLAASQLVRIREKNIPLTICVDKVAASGGYLMACVATKIYVAPFAILGSIGVLAQIPNFNRLLDNYGVDFEQVTAGQYKRNVTMFGKNTDEDREKLKEQLEEIHSLFKSSVNEYRPELNLDKVATGEYWYGTRALDLGLIDEIKTSDELLLEMSKKYEIFSVKLKIKQPLKKRLMSGVDSLLEKFEDIRWSKNFEN